MSSAGRGIVVPRPRELAEPFARLLERRGARAFVFPAIEIQPLPAPAALAQLADFNIAVFISPSALCLLIPADFPVPLGAGGAPGGNRPPRRRQRPGRV